MKRGSSEVVEYKVGVESGGECRCMLAVCRCSFGFLVVLECLLCVVRAVTDTSKSSCYNLVLPFPPEVCLFVRGKFRDGSFFGFFGSP